MEDPERFLPEIVRPEASDVQQRPSSILKAWAHTQNLKSRRNLYSDSNIVSFSVGTGASIISSATEYILRAAPRELVLVTCFWARSASLDHVVHLLEVLSDHGRSAKRKVCVRICISSLSVMQKLLHTSSKIGHIFKPKEYPTKLYLPHPQDLPGLDIQVKSVFFRPFSVIHSKFILLDRNACLLPSCNISWENWFEGCADLRGPVVQQFFDYFEYFWGKADPIFTLTDRNNTTLSDTDIHDSPTSLRAHPHSSRETQPFTIIPHSTSSDPFTDSADSETHSVPGRAMSKTILFTDNKLTPTLILPHSYHINPRFRPFPCQRPSTPPSTHLNDLLLHLFNISQHSIFMRTPNVTAPPVMDALIDALGRGVNVQIITNKAMMVWEQLVTAGTTGARSVQYLSRRYEKMRNSRLRERRGLEAGAMPVGKLHIEYFDVPDRDKRISQVDNAVKSHFKCTIVDGRIVVIGSGNMDRASWYTSQELGVALEDNTGYIAKSIGALAGQI